MGCMELHLLYSSSSTAITESFLYVNPESETLFYFIFLKKTVFKNRNERMADLRRESPIWNLFSEAQSLYSVLSFAWGTSQPWISPTWNWKEETVVGRWRDEKMVSRSRSTAVEAICVFSVWSLIVSGSG